MSLLSHNIYENVRTRVIVIHAGCLLLLPPGKCPDGSYSEAWRVPGGGLEPHESLNQCAAREVWEETGVAVRAGRVAFLKEWIVPDCEDGNLPDPTQPYGYGLEVYLYAYPLGDTTPRAEVRGERPPQWVPFAEVPGLALWPKEVKAVAVSLLKGEKPGGVHSFVAHLDSANSPAPPIEWHDPD